MNDHDMPEVRISHSEDVTAALFIGGIALAISIVSLAVALIALTK